MSIRDYIAAKTVPLCMAAIAGLYLILVCCLCEIPFAVSAYSGKGVLLTVAVSVGLFLLSTLASLRYLKKVTVSELLKEETPERSEKNPVLWCVLSVLTLAGFIVCLVITYRSLMAAFHDEDGVELLLWLAIDLVMAFLTHFTLSRTMAGMLLRSRRLKNRAANSVVLRGLSGKMTVNSLLIGALATLLVFAICMSNVAFSEKLYEDRTVAKDCPYDVMAMIDPAEENAFTMEEGEAVIEKYSPITSKIYYQLYTTGEATLCSSIQGYDSMGWTDKYMPLSQFNQLLTGCGYEPVTLDYGYLVFSTVRRIYETDFSDKTVVLNGKTYSCAGSTSAFPEFARRAWMYFVVPDEAVEEMQISDLCAAYTLKNHRPDDQALLSALTYIRNTEEGPEERSDFAVRESYRIFKMANAGTLIIGALYVSTVFVCMALAILSLKTLSTLEEERRRFAVLYRLGADERMQKSALLRQTGAFFLMPFAFPLLMTVPLGVIFGRVYEMWNLPGLSGQRAMVTAVLIALVIAGIYALYFIITYRIACSHAVCYGAESSKDGSRI